MSVLSSSTSLSPGAAEQRIPSIVKTRSSVILSLLWQRIELETYFKILGYFCIPKGQGQFYNPLIQKIFPVLIKLKRNFVYIAFRFSAESSLTKLKIIFRLQSLPFSSLKNASRDILLYCTQWCTTAQNHQTLCSAKSHSGALAAFQI